MTTREGLLTKRELEILAAAAAGELIKETAARLWLSVETVRTHRRAIRQKLRAKTIGHAIALAYELRLLPASRSL